jgi:uncharacterized membrane protein YhaH (DUF805 family)
MVQGAMLAAPPGESAAKFWLREWLSFSGRISRGSYWLQHELPMMGIVILALFLDTAVKANGVLFGLVAILSIWPNAATLVKRAHDRGRSGWFVLLCFVPILSVWPGIELGFLQGTAGPNQFGPDPLGGVAHNLTGR